MSALVLCLLAILLTSSLPAQQPLSLQGATARAQQLFSESAVTGMVLVVVRNHEVLIHGYGETFPGSNRPPDPNSELRLCSISKIFATDLLLRLAAEGKLKLDDPLARYAPRRAHVPTGPDGSPITLRSLATHTSGLAREVAAYPVKAPHFTFPDFDYRWTWLSRQRLTHSPGTGALYSNVAFDFLGDALTSAAHKPYATLLNQTLLEPLGMWDTTLVPAPAQCARLLRPVEDQGPCTDTQASGASGGIYSTPADMAKFLQYLLNIPGSPAQPAGALAVYLKPNHLRSTEGLHHAGDPTGIGLGWLQLGDPATPSAIMEKTGGGAGFTTYIALNPARHTGIFLAATDGRGNATADFYQEANNLLADLANVPPVPPKVRKPAPPQPHKRRKHLSGAPIHAKS